MAFVSWSAPPRGTAHKLAGGNVVQRNCRWKDSSGLLNVAEKQKCRHLPTFELKNVPLALT